MGLFRELLNRLRYLLPLRVLFEDSVHLGFRCFCKQLSSNLSSVSPSVMFDSLWPHSLVCSLLGFPVHGIFQARILVWVAISLSGGSYLLGHTFNCQLTTCPKGVIFSAFQVSYLSPLSGCFAYSHVKEWRREKQYIFIFRSF